MTEPEGLWTTQVGSLPKPPEILAARAGLAKGRISREELRAKERKATEDWVRLYQRPLVVADTTPAVGAWLPALLAPTAVAASERPASYQGLKVPVFIIWGERDTITPLDQGQRLARLAPHAELAVMRNVGHIPQIEDPAGFNELLLKAVAKAAIKASSASSSR